MVSLLWVSNKADTRCGPKPLARSLRGAAAGMMDGLGAVFSNSAEKAGADREAEIHELHAKIGQITVERDFLARGLRR